jgi:hypothetical protein
MWRPSAPDAEAEHAYRVSGLRVQQLLLSQTSELFVPSFGLPFFQSLYALAAISLSLGLATNVSPTWVPPRSLGLMARPAKLGVRLVADSMLRWAASSLIIFGRDILMLNFQRFRDIHDRPVFERRR